MLLTWSAGALAGLWCHDGLYGLLGWCLGIHGQPWGEWAPLFCVVATKNAADVSVVFGVAVLFAGEKILAEGGDLRRCLLDEV